MKAISQIQKSLSYLEKRLKHSEKKFSPQINFCQEAQKISAVNLIHYMTLRTEDIRDLQDLLHVSGLSSLASSESHILSQIQAIQERLGKKYDQAMVSECDYNFAKNLIDQRSKTLFGKNKAPQIPSIMVTFDQSFLKNPEIVYTLLDRGMNVARINCAHDDKKTWKKLIDLVLDARQKSGKNCKIYMDLAGPKIRTELTHKGKNKGKLKIKPGDNLWLVDSCQKFEKQELVVHTNETGVVKGLKKGHRVLFDDGVMEGIVQWIQSGKALIQITRVSGQKTKLKNGKGINFPDSILAIPSLTSFDLACLPFVVKHADLIGYSFVRYPTDVAHLQKQLNALNAGHLHIILKIETPEAVKNLPNLLLQGMQSNIFGVMIARGDLAIEIGFERMGEIQEEILWICESAHIPVIWATQVLETLNKSGLATRSEITDAAHAVMAECIMLNKGEFTLNVIDTLKDIIARMGGHHVKKRFIFRPLAIAKTFIQPES